MTAAIKAGIAALLTTIAMPVYAQQKPATDSATLRTERIRADKIIPVTLYVDSATVRHHLQPVIAGIQNAHQLEPRIRRKVTSIVQKDTLPVKVPQDSIDNFLARFPPQGESEVIVVRNSGYSSTVKGVDCNGKKFERTEDLRGYTHPFKSKPVIFLSYEPGLTPSAIEKQIAFTAIHEISHQVYFHTPHVSVMHERELIGDSRTYRGLPPSVLAVVESDSVRSAYTKSQASLSASANVCTSAAAPDSAVAKQAKRDSTALSYLERGDAAFFGKAKNRLQAAAKFYQQGLDQEPNAYISDELLRAKSYVLRWSTGQPR